jgi:hypothetical protein
VIAAITPAAKDQPTFVMAPEIGKIKYGLCVGCQLRVHPSAVPSEIVPTWW